MYCTEGNILLRKKKKIMLAIAKRYISRDGGTDVLGNIILLAIVKWYISSFHLESWYKRHVECTDEFQMAQDTYCYEQKYILLVVATFQRRSTQQQQQSRPSSPSNRFCLGTVIVTDNLSKPTTR